MNLENSNQQHIDLAADVEETLPDIPPKKVDLSRALNLLKKGPEKAKKNADAGEVIKLIKNTNGPLVEKVKAILGSSSEQLKEELVAEAIKNCGITGAKVAEAMNDSSKVSKLMKNVIHGIITGTIEKSKDAKSENNDNEVIKTNIVKNTKGDFNQKLLRYLFRNTKKEMEDTMTELVCNDNVTEAEKRVRRAQALKSIIENNTNSEGYRKIQDEVNKEVDKEASEAGADGKIIELFDNPEKAKKKVEETIKNVLEKIKQNNGSREALKANFGVSSDKIKEFLKRIVRQ